MHSCFFNASPENRNFSRYLMQVLFLALDLFWFMGNIRYALRVWERLQILVNWATDSRVGERYGNLTKRDQNTDETPLRCADQIHFLETAYVLFAMSRFFYCYKNNHHAKTNVKILLST